MASSPQSYDILVMRLEQEANRHPLLYRFRVALLGALGYAFVFGAITLPLVLLLGVCLLLRAAVGDHPGIASAAWICPLLMGLISFVLFALQTLWVALPQPRGLELKREEAVPLFQEIDRLRRALKAPRFHRVLLTNEFTAGIHQAPRWGVCSAAENILLLGVPLMASLSADQFRAVLAHEISHTSRSHGKFGNWVFRAIQTWAQLLDAFEGEDSRPLQFVVRFLRWYTPYFRACSLAIRRSCEYEADHAGARIVGAEPMASALVATALVARRLAARRADDLDSNTAHRWLNDALGRKTDADDAHPGLAARLRAIGRSPVVPAPPTETAFERYLGHRALPLAERSGVLVVCLHDDTDNVTTTQLHVPAAGPAPFVIALRPHDPYDP